MYRIHFDANCGKFCIQVRYLGLFWRTVSGIKKRVRRTLYFVTFAQAIQEVQDLGLDKLYLDGSKNQFQHYLDSEKKPGEMVYTAIDSK